MVATASANAGGFAVHEQSAYAQGTSFAGIAAGGALSSMFWNPATMTQFGGVQGEASVSGIISFASNNPTAGSFLVLGGTSNTADEALVPSGYFSYQINPDLWVGMSLNSPFGLSVSFPDLWAGRDYAAGDTFLHTYNATPSIAYRINDWISVGAGVQIQYANARLSRGVSVPFPRIGFIPVGDAVLSGNGWGYGFTAGVTLTPTPTTTIGLGYRSQMNQKIDGTLAFALTALPSSTSSASTTLNLPDMVSLGIRQRVNPQLTLLGTVEWTNWSRIGTAVVSGAPFPTSLPFEFKDGWLFSLGAEYQWTDRLTVRGGLGYEISPITDDVRIPILPDNDRFWLSVGASYEIYRGLVADLAYSHIWVRDPSINISPTSGNPWFDGTTYVGNVDAHVDILSLAIRFRLGEPAAPAKTALITK